MKEKFNCETLLTEDTVTLCITEDERSVMADGVLCLIHSVESAKMLVHDTNTLNAMDELVKKYQSVLAKLTCEK